MSKTILLVDDDRDVREAMALVLEMRGYMVETRGGGEEALERLGAGPPPDVVVVDLMMPGMSGSSFLGRLRGDPRGAPIPVVVVSGDRQVEQRARELGARVCIRKPFGCDEFIAAIEAAAAG